LGISDRPVAGAITAGRHRGDGRISHVMGALILVRFFSCHCFEKSQ
jgi:hypothetical protein